MYSYTATYTNTYLSMEPAEGFCLREAGLIIPLQELVSSKYLTEAHLRGSVP